MTKNKLRGLNIAQKILPLIALVTMNVSAVSLATFEPDDTWLSPATDFLTRNEDGYQWDAYDGGKSYAPSWGYLELDGTRGAKGTSTSLKLVVTGGRSNPGDEPRETCGGEISSKQEAIDRPENICTSETGAGGFNYWFLNDDRTQNIKEVAGANRISFYVQIPSAFGQSFHHSGEPENYTMHFGTYTRDPKASYSSGSNLGSHYYHWMNFKGTDKYWTKVIIDNHPQHQVSTKGDPGYNPTAPEFNYIEGLTRFYFKTTANLVPNPWAVRIDEFEVYNDPRPMPPMVATIAITQVADADFEINFASVGEGGGSDYVQTYEVKYSNSPITMENYNDATVVSGSPTFTGDYERYVHCEAYGLNITGDVVYFAIRQLNDNTSDIAFAEYELTNVVKLSPPKSAPGLTSKPFFK